MKREKRQSIGLAGLRIRFVSHLENMEFRLPRHYRRFEVANERWDLDVSIAALEEPTSVSGSFVYRCATFGVRRSDTRTVIEGYHPVYSRLVAKAEAEHEFRQYDLRFNERFLNWYRTRYGLTDEGLMAFSYPLEQVMFLPFLARHDAFLMHACGVVLNGKAFVFAGHSGDGKTTLARMLTGEGLELLSDERIALRKVNGSFWAYGTPWPGEGGVVSSASHPLGGVFLLEKASRHRLRRDRSSTVAAELLSRSIVP